MNFIKNGFFFMVFMFVSSIGTAQYNIDWSKMNKTQNNNPDLFYLDEDFYSITSRNTFSGTSKMLVNRFTSLQGRKKENEIKLKYKKKNLELIEVHKLKNKLWVFSSFKNNSKKMSYLFAQELHPKSLKFKGDMIKVSESHFSGLRDTNFEIIFSQDSTQILFLGLNNVKGNEETSLEMTLFNSDLEEVKTSRLKLPFDQRKFNRRRTKLDNDGNIYILTIINESKLFKFKESAAIISIKNGKTKIFNLALKDEKTIRDLDLNILENGDISCIGLYETRRNRGIEGTVYAHLTKEGKIIKLSTTPFSKDFIEKGWTKFSKKVTRDKNTLFKNYQVSEVIPNKNHGSLLIAEKFNISENYGFNNGFSTLNSYSRQSPTYTYQYGNMIIVYINTKGEVLWEKKIQKNYSNTFSSGNFISSNTTSHYNKWYTPTGPGSYNFAINDENIYVYFNSSYKNKGKRDDDVHNPNSSYNSRSLFVTKIDFEGKSKTEMIGKTKDFKVNVFPKNCKQLDANTLLIYGSDRSKERFGILKL